jgi:hypothetical protein
LILDRQHRRGLGNAHRAGPAHRISRGLSLQKSAAACRSQSGMMFGQKVKETRVVVVGEKWQFHNVNREEGCSSGLELREQSVDCLDLIEEVARQ